VPWHDLMGDSLCWAHRYSSIETQVDAIMREPVRVTCYGSLSLQHCVHLLSAYRKGVGATTYRREPNVPHAATSYCKIVMSLPVPYSTSSGQKVRGTTPAERDAL
jgi:hypothetical protein